MKRKQTLKDIFNEQMNMTKGRDFDTEEAEDIVPDTPNINSITRKKSSKTSNSPSKYNVSSLKKSPTRKRKDEQDEEEAPTTSPSKKLTLSALLKSSTKKQEPPTEEDEEEATPPKNKYDISAYLRKASTKKDDDGLERSGTKTYDLNALANLTINKSPTKKDTKKGGSSSPKKIVHDKNCITRTFRISAMVMLIYIALGILTFIIGAILLWISLSDDNIDYARDSANVIRLSGILLAGATFYDLETTQTGLSCSPNFQPLSLGFWLGINAGCECDGNLYDQCDEHPVKTEIHECQRFSFNDRFTMYVWKDINICVRYNSQVLLNRDSNCPYRFKKCNGYVCVPDGEKCPVTGLTLQSNRPGDTDEYRSFNNKYLLLHRQDSSSVPWEEKEQPLVAFTMNARPKGCLEYGHQSFQNVTFPYARSDLNCQQFGLYDESYAIDSQREIDAYDDNSLFRRFESIPTYTEYIEDDDRTFYLIGLPRFRIRDDQTCLRQGDFNVLNGLDDIVQEDLEERDFALLTLFWGGIGSIAAALIFGLVLFFIFKKKPTRYALGITSLVVSLPFGMAFFALIYYYDQNLDKRKVVSDFEGPMKNLVDNQCFLQSEINSAFDAYLKSFIIKQNDSWYAIEAIAYAILPAVLIFLINVIMLIAMMIKYRDRGGREIF